MFWPVLAFLMFVATYVRAIFFTPPEAMQGFAQKIYYVHPPSAIACYLAFTVTAIASVAYLWLRDERLDRVAASSCEVGIVFTTVVLLTGPMWAKPIWGWWWVWSDMRLTLTLFLWFIAVGYMLMRGAIDDPGRRARFSAVLGILAALLIPFIHLSVYMFQNMHPMPIVFKPSEPSLPKVMLITFLLACVSWIVMYVAFTRARYQLATLRALHEAEAA